MTTKCQLLQTLFITLLVVCTMIWIIGNLFNQGIGVSEKALIEFMISKEDDSVGAARRLKSLSTNPALQELADFYINRHTDTIARLESILKSLEK